MIVTAPKSEEKYSFDLWDARDGRKIRVLENPPMDDTGWTTYIAFSPNGRTFIAGNRNVQPGSGTWILAGPRARALIIAMTF